MSLVTDDLVLTVERLRDEVTNLLTELRRRYRAAGSQVRAVEVKEKAARLGEIWLVELASHPGVQATIESGFLADLTVHFQRLLTYSETAAKKTSYEKDIKAILKDYSLKLVIPLKQIRGEDLHLDMPESEQGGNNNLTPKAPLTAFVGMSFAEEDRYVNESFEKLIESLGIEVLSGETPKADAISNKIKERIDLSDFFVGIFTRRDKLAGKQKWTTSSWIIDEKAYAVGKNKKLVLLREQGVESIGGLQGDYEYIEFSRSALEKALLSVVELFDIRTLRLR